ncbi:hypothetical protein MTR_4g024865 [Medicago truncatula]|uniref:Uncharacterized protein n=1 Tax=Medicago truncatula TaxID=3880 RepID=Q2HS70_MEDTR|nr:hypothetical protein MtrDRAFT_AC155883g25v2 [Medicago truncatula]KEH29097.1 hypothetical protein MTR_4g024865 [Medicago truncatula]
MDGEGEEWSRLAGSGVVVDVVRWFCFGWEKKKEERASDERERGRGNEIELRWGGGGSPLPPPVPPLSVSVKNQCHSEFLSGRGCLGKNKE